MTSHRPYQRAMSTDAAVAELLRHSGTQFGPEVVAAFQEELANPSCEAPGDQRRRRASTTGA